MGEVRQSDSRIIGGGHMSKGQMSLSRMIKGRIRERPNKRSMFMKYTSLNLTYP
jgi:hypothetical protein